MLAGRAADRQSCGDHLLQHSLQHQRTGTASVCLGTATELQHKPRVWTRQCLNPVIEWIADELTVAQITAKGCAEADPDSRACPDGDHPPASPAGIKGDGYTGDCPEPGARGIHPRA